MNVNVDFLRGDYHFDFINQEKEFYLVYVIN